MFSLLLVFVLSISLALAASTISEPTVCCEQTLSGALCSNAPAAECDPNYQSSPTSCEQTSYCKLGTCYDSSEGICMENTPQSTCEVQGGTWSELEAEELPQCGLGCCIVADQGAFVPLVRCKRLSSYFGVETDFRTDIGSEVSCIAEAQSQDMGACVFERDFATTCEFTTRAECNAEESVISVNGTSNSSSSSKTFYVDTLCSAEELGAENARQTTTACYEGKVYWYDSEGQRENVYSSDLEVSWNNGRVAEPNEVCDPTSGNSDCGNCDYLLGSSCQEWDGFLGIGKPAHGEYFCKSNTCTDREGNTRKNGESWCVYDGEIGEGNDAAGSRHYREICVDGAVQVEACADFRNEVCIHSGIDTSEGEFSTAACRVNKWQDCTSQTSKGDCLNEVQRNCEWLPNVTGIDFNGQVGESDEKFEASGGQEKFQASGSSGPSTTESIVEAGNLITNIGSEEAFPTGNVIFTGNVIGSGKGQWEIDYTEPEDADDESGLCVPSFPPGFEFWKSGDAQTICAQASATCVVKFEKKTELDILGKEKESIKCVENCDCLERDGDEYTPKSEWAIEANNVCRALGDCGAYINFAGEYTDDGYIWRFENESYHFTRNDQNKITSAGTGRVVSEVVVNDNVRLNPEAYVLVKDE